ncbi:hypothetical protein Q9R29_08495 [Rothia sp. ARF10]|nr:hypothetical protein [Rothia sp. ARF10]
MTKKWAGMESRSFENGDQAEVRSGNDVETFKTRERVSSALDATMNRALESQWQRAIGAVASKRKHAPHASADEIAKLIVRDFRRDLTAIGATSGLVSFVPGPTALVRVSGFTAETAFLLERSVLMVLAVAHAYDRDLSEVEDRRNMVMQVLGSWVGLNRGVSRVSAAAAEGLGKRAVTKIPMKAVHAVNRAFDKRILVKWATKSGAVRLGSVVPAGTGVVFGGAGNNVMARGLGRVAIIEARPPTLT